MMIHIKKELNEGRTWKPRFRRFKRISGSATASIGDEFVSGEKFSGYCFVAFGRMISIFITRKVKA